MLKNILKSTFKNVGKGWFNIKETNMDAYQFSKMKRYITMIQFMIQDSLRYMTEDMLHKYTQFIIKHIGTPRIDVISLNNVACEWPKNDFADVRFCFKTKNI